MPLPEFNPDDPQELERTRRELWRATAEHSGAIKATELLGEYDSTKVTVTRTCIGCGNTFSAKRKDNLTCSPKCRARVSRRSTRKLRGPTVTF